MNHYNNRLDPACNELVHNWMNQIDNMTDQDPKVLARRKFIDISNQIIYQRARIDTLNDSLLNFSDKAEMIEIQYKVITELDLTLNEFASKILPIIEDLKTIKSDIIAIKSVLMMETIKFDELNHLYEDIISSVNDDIKKFHYSGFYDKNKNEIRRNKTGYM